MLGLIILNKISNEEAFARCLNMISVTFSRACYSTTTCTYSRISFAYCFCTTRTLSFWKIQKRSVSRIEGIILLISWCFHNIENIKTPINGMVLITVIIGANVAHSCFTASALLKCFYIWEILFIMDLAVWNVMSNWWYIISRHLSLCLTSYWLCSCCSPASLENQLS